MHPNPIHAILTPLPVEYEAVCARIEEKTTPGSQTLPTTIGKIAGQEVVCVLSGKGEANAAASFQYVSQMWNPRWIFLVGIAGGLQDTKRGDVVVPNFIYYLDFGKISGGKYIRRPEYDFAPDRSLLAYAELVAEKRSRNWTEHIKLKRPDRQPNRTTKAIVGYLGSGNKVIDDPKHGIFKAAAKTIPELHAIEMEASGVGASLRLEQSRRAIGILMIRGISDVPDENKAGKTGTAQRQFWKSYASAAAAAFLEEVLSLIPLHNSKWKTRAEKNIGNGINNFEVGLKSSEHHSFQPFNETTAASEIVQYSRILVPLEAERLFVATQ
jgi:adenosylhomocysteine nucleosidase